MLQWRTLRVENGETCVATLALSRPERRNAINLELATELAQCVSGLAQQRHLRVLVLTGDGSSFCAGGDLRERLESGPSAARRQRDMFLGAIDQLDRFPCPVLAMINGPALAGGLELALGCDIRVASDAAVLGLPEVRTAGGFPGAGGPVRLAKLIGRGRTSLVVFTGRKFSADEAFGLGMIDMVVPATRLREATYALAAEIALGSPAGMHGAKQLIRQSADIDTASAIDLSRALRDPLDDTPDFHEAMRAWHEKRSPDFPDR